MLVKKGKIVSYLVQNRVKCGLIRKIRVIFLLYNWIPLLKSLPFI
ncbi:hypothetical protein EVA_04234 [gut metagenome]|uniref:Uncharacterized protein n=1 Tax=gut metagenome TaxID=749906 RepID=J9GJ31_9ZZZZ